MNRLAQLLAEEVDFSAFSPEELASYRADLREAAHEANDGPHTAEVVGLIEVAATLCQAVDSEVSSRAAMDVQLGEQAAAALSVFGDVEPIAASSGSRIVRDVVVPGRSRPRSTARGAGAGCVLLASGAPDHRFADEGELLAALNDETRALSRGTGDTERRVATVDWRDAYGPDAPMLRDKASAADNGAILERACAEFVDRMRERGAMVASGGAPGPSEPSYVVPTFGSAARPLRDALPAVLSKRGSIIYNNAPLISDIAVDTGAANAIGTVTNAQDVSGAAKGVMEITAPSQLSATVEADYMRFSQGNFADRFLPEWTTAWLKNGQVRFARHSETRRFNDIATASTHMVDTPAKFGAYRDLRRCLLGITEELEDRFRDPSLPITVLLPEYVPAMLASDLIAQAPGDQAFDITEDRVRALLNAMDPNVNFAFVWDGNQTNQRLLTTPSGQSPRTPGFDADVDFLIFPTGAWAFLDGGMLDLGILRDSVVSATNKFQTFFEQWEAVAQLVPVSYRVTISLCADGGSQLPSAVNVCSPQGS